MQANTSKAERLAALAALAVDGERKTGVPARLIVAAWACESAWGTRVIGRNNCFGIKKALRHKLSASANTTEYRNGVKQAEVAKFADYETPAAAIADYCWLISAGTPYKMAWQEYGRSGSVDELMYAIARVYATDPAYGSLLRVIGNQSNVTKAISLARLASAKRDPFAGEVLNGGPLS